MSGRLTSRLLAVALMIALMAKPCLGLLLDHVGVAPANQPAYRHASTVAGEPVRACKPACLAGRLEDVHSVTLPVKFKLGGQPAIASVGGSPAQWQDTAGTAAAHVRSGDGSVRERLAMLSRLLL